MGIEIWVFVALVVILAVYLLPALVSRREILRYSRVQDRYSAQMRILAVKDMHTLNQESCQQGSNAKLFRRQPEVKAMNRPVVRNVQILRIERELSRAQQLHAAGVVRRKLAASHRAVLACALLGVLLGVAVVAAVTVLPWWLALVPGVLLVASMGAGRHAAVLGQREERRERQRVRDLESELLRARGRQWEQPALEVSAATQKPMLEERDVAPVSQSASLLAVEPVNPVNKVQTLVESASVAAADADKESEQTPALTSESAAVATVAVRVQATKPDSAAKPELAGAAAKVSTPAQGWTPVQVPAPTYTLVSAAPKREVRELSEAEAPTARVPARPTTARILPPLWVEPVREPIDLDAVLQQRQAAGA